MPRFTTAAWGFATAPITVRIKCDALTGSNMIGPSPLIFSSTPM